MIQTDSLKAGITQYIINEVPNGLEVASPLWKHLSGKGKKKRDGGVFIQFPIKLLENEADGFINGTSDLLNLTPNIQLQYGTLNWKVFYFATNFTLMDYAQSGGENDKIDFISEKIDGALQDSYDKVSSALHGSVVDNPKSFNGLKDIVASSGTAYAGLLDTDYEAGAYLPHISTDTLLNYQSVQRMINVIRAKRKSGKIGDVYGLMNEFLYTKYQTIIQNQQIAVNTNSLLDTGFEGFKINGVEFYLDPFCPGSGSSTIADNYLYIIPMDVLKFNYIYGIGTPSPLDGDQKIDNGTIKSSQHFMVGNLVCNNRRLIAVNKTLYA